MKGELWIEPGHEIEQGKLLASPPSLVGILGAGNFEAPQDILNKMFLENKVVVYKANPTNQAHAPLTRELLKALISDGKTMENVEHIEYRI